MAPSRPAGGEAQPLKGAVSMTRFRWSRILAVLTLALLVSRAAQALPLTFPAERDPGILSLLRQVFSFVWSTDGIALYGGTTSGDHGAEVDSDGATPSGDNGGQLDPSG